MNKRQIKIVALRIADTAVQAAADTPMEKLSKRDQERVIDELHMIAVRLHERAANMKRRETGEW